jgi:nucleotidyltransferase substrate binding protein (TIGR01987 family)
MKLDLTSLEKALSQLELSLSYLRSELAAGDPGLRAQFRAAAIQGFEYTYELAVKMIRRQMAQISAVPAELAEMTFKDLIREAADAGLVVDPESFFLYREIRNLTAHTYDEAKADKVIGTLNGFRKDVLVLLKELKRRNHATD